MKQQSQIDIKNFQSTEGFIRHYQELVRDTVIPYQYAVPRSGFIRFQIKGDLQPVPLLLLLQKGGL